MRTILGATNILLIIGTLSIQLGIGCQMIGDTLGYLPVLELIHRFVLAVSQHHSLGKLFSRILPTVITLQLEVGLR